MGRRRQDDLTAMHKEYRRYAYWSQFRTIGSNSRMGSEASRELYREIHDLFERHGDVLAVLGARSDHMGGN